MTWKEHHRTDGTPLWYAVDDTGRCLWQVYRTMLNGMPVWTAAAPQVPHPAGSVTISTVFTNTGLTGYCGYYETAEAAMAAVDRYEAQRAQDYQLLFQPQQQEEEPPLPPTPEPPKDYWAPLPLWVSATFAALLVILVIASVAGWL